MGSSTEFKGVLHIEPELSASQIAHLSKFLGEDSREHSDWEQNIWYRNLYYLNEDE